jgi:hypothetical protein
MLRGSRTREDNLDRVIFPRFNPRAYWKDGREWGHLLPTGLRGPRVLAGNSPYGRLVIGAVLPAGLAHRFLR